VRRILPRVFPRGAYPTGMPDHVARAAHYGSAPASGVAWSLDATSGQAVPADATEWAAFIAANSLTIAAPTNLYLCQEASGNLADSIGALTLAAANTPLYQQAVTGWTRKGVGFNGGTAQHFANTGYPAANTSSRFILMYWSGLTAAPLAGGTMLTHGTNITAIGVSQNITTGRARYRNGATIVDTTAAVTATPIAFLHNIDTSAARLYTNAQKLSPAYAAAAGTNLYIGAQSGASILTGTLYYLAIWSGAAAEVDDAQVLALHEALGWSPSWT
jgi:hypothetical protein